MSENTAQNEKQYCRYCEKEVHGRMGKIFCNVDCKNNYNSRIRAAKRAEENKLFPDVIKTIKNNYRILLSYKLHELRSTESILVEKSELKEKGFDHRYCTGAAMDFDKKLWKCCFAFCWQEEKNYITFKYDPALNSRSIY